jgi:hypothetical protein
MDWCLFLAALVLLAQHPHFLCSESGSHSSRGLGMGSVCFCGLSQIQTRSAPSWL